MTRTHSFPKQSFLDDLLARNAVNLELVQTTFAPLDRDARTAQPEPGEWCVDQCLQHLVLTFDLFLAGAMPLLERDAGVDSADTFTRSWLARHSFYRQASDPTSKRKSIAKNTPSDHYYPDVYAQFAAQKARFETIVERARRADLQRRGWFLRIVPINLGDFLEAMVDHDDLHIDQARRALAAYRQSAASV